MCDKTGPPERKLLTLPRRSFFKDFIHVLEERERARMGGEGCTEKKRERKQQTPH